MAQQKKKFTVSTGGFMIKGIYVITKNMYAKEKDMEIVANNLAHINTTGYKRELPFSEIIARYQDQPGKNITDHSQGTFFQTTNPLDVAISGNGFFAVQTGNGIELTRNGHFKLSDEGLLVNEQGNKVLGIKGSIDFLQSKISDSESVYIAKDGEIKVGDKTIGHLMIVKVDNNLELARKEGLNFISGNDVPFNQVDEGEVSIKQGFLEESNVNPMLEIQSMISIHKEFESAQKIIIALDRALEKGNEVGRI